MWDRNKTVIGRVIGVLLCIASPFIQLKAHLPADTGYLVSKDTLTGIAPDTVVHASADTEAISESSFYVQKHSYDSSEKFFTWKAYPDEVYSLYDTVRWQRGTEAFLAQLRNEKDFWYVKEVERFAALKPVYRHRQDSLRRAQRYSPDEDLIETPPAGSGVSILLWSLIGGILLFALVYFFVINKLSFFARSDRAIGSAEEGAGHVNIFELPYAELLKTAYAEKDFPLVVRILYLQTLKLLSEKELIDYQGHFTNLSYLHQLRSTAYFDDFFSITRNYEYVWYGGFELPETAFRTLEQRMLAFQQKLASI